MTVNGSLLTLVIGLDRLYWVWATKQKAGGAVMPVLAFQMTAGTLALMGVPFLVSGAIITVALLDNQVF